MLKRLLPLFTCIMIGAATARSQQLSGHDGAMKVAADSVWHTYSSANSPLPASGFQFVLDRAQGIAWCAGTDSLYSFDGTLWTSYALPASGTPTGLALDSTGDIWGTFKAAGKAFIVHRHGDSMTMYDGQAPSTGYTAELARGAKIAFTVTSPIQAGINGDIWIDAGPNMLRFNGGTWRSYNSDNSLYPTDPTNHLVDNAGNMWVGTMMGGLDRFDGTQWKEVHLNQTSTNPGIVFPMAVDRHNHIWAYSVDLKRITAEYDGTGWISKDSSDTSWINKGVPVFDVNNNPWVRSRSYDGIARHADSAWWHYTSANSGLPNDSVSNMDVDDHGTAWIVSGNRFLTTLDGSRPPQDAFYSIVSLEAPAARASAQSLSMWPNPTAAMSTARFTLTSAADVRVTVVDMLGRDVATVYDGRMAAGEREVTIDASRLRTGSYVLRLDAGSATASRSFVVTH